jgi:hypothetical protein
MDKPRWPHGCGICTAIWAEILALRAAPAFSLSLFHAELLSHGFFSSSKENYFSDLFEHVAGGVCQFLMEYIWRIGNASVLVRNIAR